MASDTLRSNLVARPSSSRSGLAQQAGSSGRLTGLAQQAEEHGPRLQQQPRLPAHHRQSEPVIGHGGLRRVPTWCAWDRELADGAEGSSLTSRNPDARRLHPAAEHHQTAEEKEFAEKLVKGRYVKYFEKAVFWYNAEAIIGLGVFPAALTRASILCRKQLLRDLFLIMSCSLCAGVGLHVSGVEVVQSDLDKLSNLVKDFQSLCTFLLGFFVSTCVTRWWAIRNDCIGLLWGCADDLALIIGSYFGRNTPEDKAVREQVRRWSVLSYELVYKQARAEKEDMSDLIQKGFLTERENEILLQECSKPQVVWGWMCSYFCHLAYGDPEQGGSRLPYPVTVLPQLHEICRHARGAIGALFAYTDTQVPFRYVHFLALIIWMHNLFQAVMSACVISNSLSNDSIMVTTIAIEVIFLFFHPLIYFGLLHLGVGMLNPLRGKRDIDFPKGAWTFYMHQEIGSIFDANSAPKGPPWGGPVIGSDANVFQPSRGGTRPASKSGGLSGDITIMQTPLPEEEDER